MCLFERIIDPTVRPMLLQSLLAADAHHLSANQNQEQEQGLHRQHDTTRCNPAYHPPDASQDRPSKCAFMRVHSCVWLTGHEHMLRGYVSHSRVDHMASYGQLVGQQSYDDSSLFDRHARTAEGSEAASSSRPPALKITVADPLKKVTFCLSSAICLFDGFKESSSRYLQLQSRRKLINVRE